MWLELFIAKKNATLSHENLVSANLDGIKQETCFDLEKIPDKPRKLYSAQTFQQIVKSFYRRHVTVRFCALFLLRMKT